MEKITDRDLQDYRMLSQLQILPGAKQAALVVTQMDFEQNAYLSDLYLLDIATGKHKPLTSGGDVRSFAPYGKNLIFPGLRQQKDKDAIAAGDLLTVFYEIPLDGGEAREAFRLPLAGATAQWIAGSLYLISAVQDNARPDFAAMKGEARQKAWQEYRQSQEDYTILDEAPFWFNGRGYTNKKRNRLYLYDCKKKKLTPITEPMFEVRGKAISPCGGKIAYAGDLVDARLNMYSGIWEYDLATGQHKQLLKADHYSGVHSLTYCAGRIFFGAEEHGPDWMRFGGTNLYSVEENGKVQLEIPVAQSQDLGSNPGSDCRYGSGKGIMAVGDRLYYVSAHAHDSAINLWSPGQQAARLTGADCSVDFFDICQDVALTVGFAGDNLQEVYRLDLATGTQKPLSKFNTNALKNKYVATPQPLNFVNKECNTIEGWVLLPKDYDSKKKYPAALDIHGGPRAIFGTCFFHQMQTMASDGCFVIYCNPTGSGGLGDAFADISGRYGTVDYEDLMQFVDEALKQYPAIDEKRLGVLGGSYGGFMCNWIIGHNNRFAAAASQRSIASWITLFGTCDIGLSFDLREVQATPFTDMHKMWDQSPMQFANKAKTPTLFIHSEQDYRCWLPEGISMYTALQLHGVPTRLCLFKGENHELSRSGKPLHRLRRLKEIKDWLYQYIMA